MGADAFVPVRGDRRSCRELCTGCPVRQECLEVAPADFGLRGETTPAERKEMRRGVVA